MDADGMCMCMCMEMRDIHIHRQTDRRTHALIHKHINDDEDRDPEASILSLLL